MGLDARTTELRGDVAMKKLTTMTYYAKGETHSDSFWTFTIDFKGHPTKMDHYDQIEVHGDKADAKKLRDRILEFLRETQP